MAWVFLSGECFGICENECYRLPDCCTIYELDVAVHVSTSGIFISRWVPLWALNGLQREFPALVPLLEHPVADFCKIRMFLHIGAEFHRGFRKGVRDALKDLFDLSGGACHARFPQSGKLLASGPLRSSVQRESHTVFWHVDGGGDQI